MAAMVAASCAARAEGPVAPKPATHQAQAARLRELMHGLDDTVRRDVPEQVDQHDRWQGVFGKIADAAAGLRRSSKALSGDPPEGLDMPERGRFQVLARTMEQRAAELEQAASRADADRVEAARRDIESSCRDCHETYRANFRGIPGELD